MSYGHPQQADRCLRIRSDYILRKHKRDMQVLDKYGDEMIKSGEDIL